MKGQREIVSQRLTGDLQVLDARLEPLLIPGQSSDLVVRVRNRSAKPVTLDRIRLTLPLRTVAPAGCTARLSGPPLSVAGMAVPPAQRVTVPAGRVAEVTVPKVLTLGAAATSGCGFRVTVTVQAVQNPPTTKPTTRPTTTAPTTESTASPTTPPPPPGDPTPVG